MENLLETELPPELRDLPNTPEFQDFWAHCPFRWQGDHGAMVWLDRLYNWQRLSFARPTLTLVAPGNGTPPLTIDCVGANYRTGVKVLLAGYELASVSFVNQGRLTCQVAGSFAGLAPAAYNVAVVNPDNQISTTQTFTITAAETEA